MHEVKRPLEIGLLCKSQVITALQKVADMIDCPEEVDYFYLQGYRDCLRDYQLIGEDKRNLKDPNEILMYDMKLNSRNLVRGMNKLIRMDADAEGYAQCLADLGLLEECDESDC